MTAAQVLDTIDRAYLASYELRHEGTDFYWVSAMDPLRRVIAGTRSNSLAMAAWAAEDRLGTAPLRFEERSPSAIRERVAEVLSQLAFELKRKP